ncbi:MAG TPA: hypothetical protein VIC86_05825 [Acidimicrobiales bacterium]
MPCSDRVSAAARRSGSPRREDRGPWTRLAAATFYEGNPAVTGVITMPATFTPGRADAPGEAPF